MTYKKTTDERKRLLRGHSIRGVLRKLGNNLTSTVAPSIRPQPIRYGPRTYAIKKAA